MTMGKSMTNRETERQRHRGTEGHSHRESEVTQETEEKPPVAASVTTLQQAVQISLAGGLGENCLFVFARALKAFEITHNRRLPPPELQTAFSLWWTMAKPLLPPDADVDEWRFDFEDTFAKTHSALGSNSLAEAIRLADAGAPPPQAARYSSMKLKRLIAVCYHLQRLQGDSPFFISVRDAAKIAGARSLPLVSAWLSGLVRDRVLTEVAKGTRKHATRFRFNQLESTPGMGENVTKSRP